MTVMGIPANAKQLAAFVKEGEGPALEFKRSTGELKEGIQTLCAFLNGSGGMVLFGVRPFTYDGRAYERVESTTRRMPQAKYERLLLDRAHGTRRWENEPAEGVELRDPGSRRTCSRVSTCRY